MVKLLKDKWATMSWSGSKNLRIRWSNEIQIKHHGNKLDNTGRCWRCWGQGNSSTQTQILRKHHKKKQTKSPEKPEPVGLCWITSSSWRNTAGLWGWDERRVNTNPLIMSKMFGVSWYSNHKQKKSTQEVYFRSIHVGWGDTAVRRGWSWWTWPTSAAELAPHIPTGSCNRKTWCLSAHGPEWPITMGGKELEVHWSPINSADIWTEAQTFCAKLKDNSTQILLSQFWPSLL